MVSKAKTWVEEHFPAVPRGPMKAMLILAYGAGMDAGMSEAQDVIEQAAKEVYGLWLSSTR